MSVTWTRDRLDPNAGRSTVFKSIASLSPARVTSVDFPRARSNERCHNFDQPTIKAPCDVRVDKDKSAALCTTGTPKLQVGMNIALEISVYEFETCSQKFAERDGCVSDGLHFSPCQLGKASHTSSASPFSLLSFIVFAYHMLARFCLSLVYFS